MEQEIEEMKTDLLITSLGSQGEGKQIKKFMDELSSVGSDPVIHEFERYED